MKAKFKLRLLLAGYVCFLLITPTIYSLYSVFVDGVASFLAISAIVQFINYLKSRKSSEKNILNRQMLLNFYLKLIYYPLYYMMIYVGYSSLSPPVNELETILASTILSYSSTRIWLILTIAMYMLLSASRALLIISPGTFLSLDAKFFQRVSLLVIIIIFIFELIISQVVYSTCDVNEKGHQLHTLMDLNFFSDDIQIEIDNTSFTSGTDQEMQPNYEGFSLNGTQLTNGTTLGGPRVCFLFPSFKIILFLIIIFEMTRLTVALGRLRKSIKLKKVGPKASEHQAAHALENPTHSPVTNETALSLPPPIAALSLTPSQMASTKTLPLPQGSLLLPPSCPPVLVHVASATSEDNQPLPLNPTVLISRLDSISTSHGASESHTWSDVQRCQTSNTMLVPQAKTFVFKSPHCQTSSSQVCRKERSLSVPTIASERIPERRCSIQFSPQVTTTVKKKNSIIDIKEIQGKRDLEEIKSYISLLIWRTYSLVVFIIVLHSITFLLPEVVFKYFRQMRLQSMICKLDLFFVPVFWILVDKDVWVFTKKDIRKKLIMIKIKCMPK